MDRYQEEDGSQSPIPNDPAIPLDVNQEEDVFVLDDFGANAEQSSPEGAGMGAPELLQTNVGDPGNETYVLGEDEDSSVIVGDATSELEMVQLGAAAGEAAAVEPPAEALTEAAPAMKPEPTGGETPEEEVKPRRTLWFPMSIAAAALLSAGAYFLYQNMAVPEETSTVAALPVKSGTEGGVKGEASGPKVVKDYTRPEPEFPPGPTVSEPEVAVAPTPEPAESDPVAMAEGGNPEGAEGEATPSEEPGLPVGDAELVNPEAAAGEVKAVAPGTAFATLTRGTEVLVRLRNGNFFNGKLDRFTPDEARLRFPKGVIEFQVRDVEAIVPMTQAPKKVGPQTVVELQNGNKLAGRLVEDLPTHVTLAVGGAEITVPRAAIASVSLRSPLGLVMGEEVTPAPTPTKE